MNQEFCLRETAVRLTHQFIGTWLTVALVCNGCGASYKPTLSRFDPIGLNSRKTTVGDLTVYVEEYASVAKSIRAFDTNLPAAGVLPVLFLVENNSAQSFDLKLQDIVVRRDRPLKALTPHDAATRAERGAFTEAAGWSLIVPIVTIPAAAALSAVDTMSVNKKINQDFDRKGFSEGPIEGGKRRSGFLFYQLEDGMKTLNGLIFELKAKNLRTSEMVLVTISLPETMLTLGEEGRSR